jgi:hypothetical protein
VLKPNKKGKAAYSGVVTWVGSATSFSPFVWNNLRLLSSRRREKAYSVSGLEKRLYTAFFTELRRHSQRCSIFTAFGNLFVDHAPRLPLGFLTLAQQADSVFSGYIKPRHGQERLCA